MYRTTLPDITIPSGTNVSAWVYGDKQYSDAVLLLIQAPAVLDGATTFVIEVSDEAGNAATLQTGDTPIDLNPPAAGKARTYVDLLAAYAFRIKSSANVAADRIFKPSKLTRLG
jgi:hypothetical protein